MMISDYSGWDFLGFVWVVKFWVRVGFAKAGIFRFGSGQVKEIILVLGLIWVFDMKNGHFLALGFIRVVNFLNSS